MGRSMVVLSCAAALALSACGGDDEEAAVRGTVVAYGEAVAKKDYQRICDELVDPELSEDVEQIGLPCELAFKQGLDAVRRPTLSIGAVAVDGDRALVDVASAAQGQPPSKDRLTLLRRGDAWRISALSEAPGAARADRRPPGPSRP